MKHDAKLEQLLQQALSPEKEPDYWLNQKILRKAKETEAMKNKTYRKRIPAAVLTAAAVLAAGSVTTAAAWKYLTLDQVAEETQDQGIAAAFQSEDAISINETQEYGNYRITLLGVVSGDNLSKYVFSDDAEGIRNDRTYVVTAIENTDGSPRPSVSEESYGEEPFFVSPLIKGKNPAWYNSMTMNGGYSEFVQDGIQYRITETDNVEMFADRTLYLAVNDGTFYAGDAYCFDEATGEITRNENYEGVNALFTLPLDEKKADQGKAEAYLKELDKEIGGISDKEGTQEEEGGETEDFGQSGGAADNEETVLKDGLAEKIADWKEADLEKNAALLEELTQTLTVDAGGYFSYSYQIGEDKVKSSATMLAESLFKEGQVGMSECMQVVGEEYIETFTRNEDGTITLKVYQYTGE